MVHATSQASAVSALIEALLVCSRVQGRVCQLGVDAARGRTLHGAATADGKTTRVRGVRARVHATYYHECSQIQYRRNNGSEATAAKQQWQRQQGQGAMAPGFGKACRQRTLTHPAWSPQRVPQVHAQHRGTGNTHTVAVAVGPPADRTSSSSDAAASASGLPAYFNFASAAMPARNSSKPIFLRAAREFTRSLQNKDAQGNGRAAQPDAVVARAAVRTYDATPNPRTANQAGAGTHVCVSRTVALSS